MPNINQAYRWAIVKCNQSNIGYSQDYRNQQTVDGVTYYDCSSFINYALIAGGFSTPSYAPDNNAFTTSSMGAELVRLGFRQLTAGSSFKWRAGDIGVSSSHTEMCYKAGTGSARFMGAHSSSYDLDDQVSVSSGASTFPTCYRWITGTVTTPGYNWHAKNTGAYDRTSEEAIENAYCMADILITEKGWTSNALAGILGNMGSESGYNPWRWQSDLIGSSTGSPWTNKGYGLVQFTPAGKYINSSVAQSYAGYDPNFSDKTGNANDGAAQIRFIDSNADYIATSSYPLSYSEYKTSTESASYLAAAWLYNYERPADPSATVADRQSNATYWQSVLDNYVPGGESSLIRYGGVRDVLRRLIIHA